MAVVLAAAVALGASPGPLLAGGARAETGRAQAPARDGAAPDRAETAEPGPRPVQPAPDEEVIRNLELLERLELLDRLELFDPAGDPPPAPNPE